MFDIPLHPKVVHLPIALAVLMPAVTLGLLIAWWRQWLPERTWWIAVILQLTLFGSGWLAYETGEQQEDTVEKVLKTEAPLETHEHRAKQFFWGSAAVSLLMVLPMLISGRTRRQWLAVIATTGTFVVFWLGYQVGDAGGDLVYRHGAADAFLESDTRPATTQHPETDR